MKCARDFFQDQGATRKRMNIRDLGATRSLEKSAAIPKPIERSELTFKNLQSFISSRYFAITTLTGLSGELDGKRGLACQGGAAVRLWKLRPDFAVNFFLMVKVICQCRVDL